MTKSKKKIAGVIISFVLVIIIISVKFWVGNAVFDFVKDLISLRISIDKPAGTYLELGRLSVKLMKYFIR
ncbi:hypothetical protein [Metabacillus fastidiosus]|uniref:hypothetical protein n=1 Tax=Metabacillus fastidiosus TaxID=1458 RepID=UPI002E1BC22B|nr:hypothetical protein [Metabacillus fastidiosus]